MTALLALLAIAAFGAIGIAYFLSSTPAQIAATMRYAGPVVLAVVGLILSLAGRFAVGGPIMMMAVAWFARQRKAGWSARRGGQTSTVRSAWLEMELDHDTGEMNGIVLVGRYENRALNDMSDDEVQDLASDIADDRESRELLEAYLDRRMPGWRDHVEPDGGARQTASYDAGAMTHQEAYKVLGLQPGASSVEVRQAHRRLMQRVHPDLGGNAFLAQRVNEARDLLLGDHAGKDP